MDKQIKIRGRIADDGDDVSGHSLAKAPQNVITKSKSRIATKAVVRGTEDDDVTGHAHKKQSLKVNKKADSDDVTGHAQKKAKSRAK